MRLYRLTQQQHAADAWRGNGASLFGGRWNHKGTPAVYAASSVSLAILEVLAHVQNSRLLAQYQLLSIEVPEALIARLPHEYLPDDWQQDPPPLSTRDLGNGWLKSADSVALLLPSSLVPMEANALINPTHPQFEILLSSVNYHGSAISPRLMSDDGERGPGN